MEVVGAGKIDYGSVVVVVTVQLRLPVQHTSACVNIRQHTSAGGNSDVISKIGSSCDFENWARLDAYRKQDVVIRRTLEGGFQIINNQENLLAHF